MGVINDSFVSFAVKFEEGKSAALEGDIENARKILSPIAREIPSHPASYFLCLVESKFGNLDSCEEYCSKFLAHNAKHPGMRTISARLFMARGELGNAQKELDIALKASPGHQAALRAQDELKRLNRQKTARDTLSKLSSRGLNKLIHFRRIKEAGRLRKMRPVKKWDADLLEATIAYFHNAPDVSSALTNFVPELIGDAVEFGYCTWPWKIQSLIKGRTVLDVGCGFGGYAIGFLCAGAKSYTGIDPAMKLDEKRMRNKRLRQWVPVQRSARDIMEIVPAIELRQVSTRDIIGEKRFDVVCLHNVTEHLMNIEGVFDDISKLLVSGGKIVFLHHNYYGWSGHHMRPHHPDVLEEENPEHLKYCDWNHIKIMDDIPEDHYIKTSLNRIRIGELKKLTENYFRIESWEHKYSPKVVLQRLTPEIQEGVFKVRDDLTTEELKTNAVYCVATL
ncbi:class I SAM-dependent methyltransferase [Pseudovibrio exalbescens]|uniref:class I SAM-dependent methyltransferase n=1 Tax=Pseudovibrio exalbescens TaxID=197461 RepID=UPI002365E827|nr:class I SAM-dependent methyltransferase [Pseudovibrio exalbescens]MDD7911564.1 class I SAM-dependent methyltransferase [Pseudovibrio exalbescens]